MDLSGGPLPNAGGKSLRPFRVFIGLCTWILQTNPLGWVLRQHPNHLLFATWAIGLLLVLWSYLLGVGRFDVEVQFLFDDPKGHADKVLEPEVRTLATGYIQELDYGPWYGLPFLCPAVYCLAGIITRMSNRNGSANYSFLSLMAMPLGRAVAWGLLAAFCIVNVALEFTQQSSSSPNENEKIGVGWVQAPDIATISDEIEKNHQPHELKNKRHFVIETKEGTFIRLAQERILTINFHGKRVADPWLVSMFVVIAKTWVGIWQALATYLGLVAFYVALRLGRDIVANEQSQQQRRELIQWARQPTKYIFILGVLVNIFHVLRFANNFYKGNYGWWDQESETWALLLPGFLLLLVASWIKIKIVTDLSHETDDAPAFLTASIKKWFVVWLITTAFVLYLLTLPVAYPLSYLMRWIVDKFTGIGLK